MEELVCKGPVQISTMLNAFGPGLEHFNVECQDCSRVAIEWNKRRFEWVDIGIIEDRDRVRRFELAVDIDLEDDLFNRLIFGTL